jgi:hypothetical protein
VEGASCGVVIVDVSEAFWDTEEFFWLEVVHGGDARAGGVRARAWVPRVELGSESMMIDRSSGMIGGGDACGGDRATTYEPRGAEVIAHVFIGTKDRGRSTVSDTHGTDMRSQDDAEGFGVQEGSCGR